MQKHTIEQYPALKKVAGNILHDFDQEEGYDPEDVHLEIKVAKLVRSKNPFGYKKMVEQSQGGLLVVNYRHDYRDHRINALATCEEYETVTTNCIQICKSRKIEPDLIIDRHVLNIKAVDEKFAFEEGNEVWWLSTSTKIFDNQINILNDSKEFRMNFFAETLVEENAEKQIADICEKNKYKFFDVIRFKHQTIYPISDFYVIVVSQIYQSQDYAIAKDFQQIREVVGKDKKKLQELMKNKIKGSPKLKHEIQLRLTIKGIKRLLDPKRNKHTITELLSEIHSCMRKLLEKDKESVEELEDMLKGLAIQ